ncbi:MAG: lipoprotein [Xanthomonadaceae bacterium]|jgi:predicted small lipoprotein YifL|nr:lipoprotein [Xanthomonadaceae bacterium]MDE2278020.1 lipoprotein [Xanthomonadaceae bacterium]
MRRLLLPPLCLAAALLAGCGNKGPLYLPPPPKPAQWVAPAQSAPATAQSAAAPAGSSATH